MTVSSSRPPLDNAPLAEWLDFIALIHPREIELGLARVSRVAKRLGLGKPAPCVITVAGTNGKGSSVRSLEALLQRQGYRTGAYTSPHIVRFNERIRVNERLVDDCVITRCFAAIEAARGDDSLSYFEFTTLAALLHFSKSELDFALLEVGLGGRLDAVNIVDPDLCLITNISRDHEEWLGAGREKIGAEKAGILRRKTPFVFADRDPPASVLQRARELECEPVLIGRDFDYEQESGSWALRLQSPDGSLQLKALPVPALHPANVAAALQCLSLLGRLPAPSLCCEVLSQLSLDGRFEKRRDVASGRRVVLDVAHNEAAALALRQSIEDEGLAPVRLVFAVLADKAVEDIARALESVVDVWYITSSSSTRAHSSQALQKRLAAVLPKAELKRYDNLELAFEAATQDPRTAEAEPRAQGTLQTVVVTGSFTTLAEIYDRAGLLKGWNQSEVDVDSSNRE